MSKALLEKIQTLNNSYADARYALDAANLAKDKFAKDRNWQLLQNIHEKLMPLYDEFYEKYKTVDTPLTFGDVVIWRRGTVGLQGILLDEGTTVGSNVICSISTDKGVYNEYAGNLMLINAVI